MQYCKLKVLVNWELQNETFHSNIIYKYFRMQASLESGLLMLKTMLDKCNVVLEKEGLKENVEIIESPE